MNVVLSKQSHQRTNPDPICLHVVLVSFSCLRWHPSGMARGEAAANVDWELLCVAILHAYESHLISCNVFTDARPTVSSSTHGKAERRWPRTRAWWFRWFASPAELRFGHQPRLTTCAHDLPKTPLAKYTNHRLPSLHTSHSTHIPHNHNNLPHNGHPASLQRPLAHHPGQDTARADVSTQNPSPQLSPDRLHHHTRNVHLWLTKHSQQHLPEPRRCCHHTRYQDSPDQGQQGRLQGHSSRWPGVQDPRAGRSQEQHRPAAG